MIAKISAIEVSDIDFQDFTFAKNVLQNHFFHILF